MNTKTLENFGDFAFVFIVLHVSSFLFLFFPLFHFFCFSIFSFFSHPSRRQNPQKIVKKFLL